MTIMIEPLLTLLLHPVVIKPTLFLMNEQTTITICGMILCVYIIEDLL